MYVYALYKYLLLMLNMLYIVDHSLEEKRLPESERDIITIRDIFLRLIIPRISSLPLSFYFIAIIIVTSEKCLLARQN